MSKVLLSQRAIRCSCLQDSRVASRCWHRRRTHRNLKGARMLTRKVAIILTMSLALLLVPGSSGAQDAVKGSLAKANHIRCTFPLMVVGTWGATQPEAKVKP